MPNTFSTLIVPATIAQEDVIRQLLLYFEQVFLYTPTENNQQNLPPELNDLCQQYAPAPFGEFLTNFEKLIDDMTHNRAEYYGGGLSSLSSKARNTIDEESVWRLIKRLSSGTTNTAQQETLFQARLLLKLAEIRDQEEQEITQSLSSLDAQDQAMLRGLTYGEEEDTAELGVMASDNNQYPRGDSLDKRLQAWAHLFLADPRMEHHWLLAATPDVLSVLTDHATTSIDQKPALIISLPLPRASLMMGLSPAQYCVERSTWQAATAKCQSGVRTAVTSAATTGNLVESSAIEQEINSHLKQFKNWGTSEQDSLDFWLLPLSLPRLFAKICRRPEPPTTTETMAHCVVAVPRQPR